MKGGAFHRLSEFFLAHANLIAAATLVPALIYRWAEATGTFLNPDEAQYFEMGVAERFVEMLRRSNETHHPPLIPILLYWTTRWTVAEWALRLFPMLAGVFGPWFVYRWLALVWNRTAGYLALVMLAYSPSLIWLGAQARGYTLALMGAAISLYGLERAMREREPLRPMLTAAAGLYLAIVSEFNTAFFAAAAGVYFLLRARTKNFSAGLWRMWAAIQAGGAALYVLLYFTHIRPAALNMSTDGARAPGGYIYLGFPQDGENGLAFLIKGALRQAAYLGASIPIGAVFVVGCVLTLWLIWKRRDADERGRLAAMLALPAVSFLLAAAGAFAGFHPFMGSRHTTILLLPLVVTAAPGLARILRGREGLLLPLAVVVTAAWPVVGRHDPHNIPVVRHQRVDVIEAARTFCEQAPEGARILTDRAAWRVFRYYLTLEGCGPGFDPGSDGTRFRVTIPRYTWWDERQPYGSLMELAAEDPKAAEETWIVDGGWNLVKFETRRFREITVERFEFNGAMRIVRVEPKRVREAADAAPQ